MSARCSFGNLFKKENGGSSTVSIICMLKHWMGWALVIVCEGWRGHVLVLPPGSQHTRRVLSVLVTGSQRRGPKGMEGRYWRSVELRTEWFWLRLSWRYSSSILFSPFLSRDRIRGIWHFHLDVFDYLGSGYDGANAKVMHPLKGEESIEETEIDVCEFVLAWTGSFII